MLVEQYREERGDGSDREVETLAKIRRAIDSSVSLRNKRDLILAFVDVKEDWRRFVGGGARKSSVTSSRTKGSIPTRPGRSSRERSGTAGSRRRERP